MLLYVFPSCESSVFKEVQRALFPLQRGNTMPVTVLVKENGTFLFILKQKLFFRLLLALIPTNTFPMITVITVHMTLNNTLEDHKAVIITGASNDKESIICHYTRVNDQKYDINVKHYGKYEDVVFYVWTN